MTPQQYCEDKAAKSGSSFYSSFRYLPADKRDAMVALYAFCREVDDVVDEIHDDNVARTTLAWWRTELAALYEGTPSHPVMQALKPHVAAFDLPQAWLAEIIDGMQMDLDVPRYSRYSDLQLYCHRVAGAGFRAGSSPRRRPSSSCPRRSTRPSCRPSRAGARAESRIDRAPSSRPSRSS